ncbi:UDP-N-acetylglucosamine 1-carboxyvinyltransferase [Streptomyces pseudovenezuelae]|uniref:UDP-N-acetylglucosamine 1-carboxyvinyltransferase n=1 Tax=Streptomyces pseudovenezuelae TaxID=67350 RepID=UPI00371D9093
MQIQGGHRLQGKAKLQGAKGSAVLLSAAVFVAGGQVTLSNMPSILDVDVAARIAIDLGHEVRLSDGVFNFLPGSPSHPPQVTEILGRRLRVTPSLAGAILAKEGQVRFPFPGGDAFCARPIDRHLDVMKAAGATIDVDGGNLTARLTGGRPTAFKFSAMTRSGPTLGATVTALLLASRARGTSLITQPSPEPEVEQVLAFLRGCGVATSRRFDGAIEVAGSPDILGTSQALPPDRLEAGTLAIAAVLTGGSVHLADFAQGDLPHEFWSLIREAGATISSSPAGCEVVSGEHLHSTSRQRRFTTAPHPGFPTDLQPQATVLATQLAGITYISEGVHALRSSHIGGLRRFGARISLSGRTMTVSGPTPLRATDVSGDDIRCVVAYMLAALAADGVSHIHGEYHLRRGHGDLLGALRALGADIHQEEIPGRNGTGGSD